ncbi:iron ABC transporter permease [Thermoactinomyces daqus]|uniref:Iron ABC transporter permease n=1 Tax=Thermoactinomyces daqus TaxID=1329516 RepID=A0A7W1X8V4_9BACL|nr:iron ABC transporter permease [Thermoactinomyces daqus]MBA4542124.1 iron ABC transporter permease [Thermoactinomyces daqus]
MGGLYTGRFKWAGLLAGVVLVAVLAMISISVGVTRVPLSTVVESFIHYQPTNNEHLIIRTTRVPRTVFALVVGASLAVAGALMQALTKNPLASPATLGVNAGASLFIVGGVTLFSITAVPSLMILGFIGAAVAAAIVYFLGSVGREGLSPLKLTLAGAAIAAFFASITQGMLVMNEKGLNELLFWLTGSVEGRSLESALPMFPFMLVGWLLALWMAPNIDILTMGEDVARGLGMKTGLIKGIGALIVVLLAGGSVAVAGPIAFVGLVVPHFVRAWVGASHRFIIPYAAVYGAALLMASDIAGRLVMNQQEIPVGVMTAILGTPFFIYLAGRKGSEEG